MPVPSSDSCIGGLVLTTWKFEIGKALYNSGGGRWRWRMWTLPGGVCTPIEQAWPKAALEEDIRNGSHRGCFGAFSSCCFGFVSVQRQREVIITYHRRGLPRMKTRALTPVDTAELLHNVPQLRLMDVSKNKRQQVVLLGQLTPAL